MDLGIEGRHALVTGSTSGIGVGIATRLAEEGAAVVVHGRSESSAKDVLARIAAAGGTAAYVLGDLTVVEDIDHVVTEAVRAFDGIDILVNCYGASTSFNSWFATTPEDWNARWESSTMHAVRLIYALVPAMRERGWGRVVNIGTASAFKPTAFSADYAAAKLALHGIAVSLSKELLDCGVTVNTVNCGLVMTDNTVEAMRGHAQALGFEETGDALERRLAGDVFDIPLRRAGRLDEIGAAVAFLASEPAAYITGATLRVDGGVSGFVH
jgi:3-oxoacyl-[acyl-carrier protein] reductase